MHRKEKFINNVKKYFKYDELSSVIYNFKAMEFTVDIAIGDFFFIDFVGDNVLSNEDVERMQKITLANTYENYDNSPTIIDEYGVLTSNKQLYETNDYRDQYCKYFNSHDEYEIHSFNGGEFIRVKDENCLSWLTYIYGYYNIFSDMTYNRMEQEPALYEGKSEDLIKLDYYKVEY